MIKHIIFRTALLIAVMATGVTRVHAQQGMTLEQALDIAESNSPAMKRTRLNLVRSQENLNAQNAALKSNLSLTVNPFSYSHNREFIDLISSWNSTKTTESFGLLTISQPIKLTDARISLINRFGYNDSYSEYNDFSSKGFSNRLSLNLEQPLFTYNRTKLQLKELELALENARLSYAIQRLALENQVTQSFYYVYQQQQSLRRALTGSDNDNARTQPSGEKVAPHLALF